VERRRALAIGSAAVVVVVGVVLALAFVPRTIATGGSIVDEAGEVLDRGWEVRAAPGLLRPRVDVRTETSEARIRWAGGPPAGIEDSRVVVVDGLLQPVTVLTGPTPLRTGSVRHTTDARIPGEAVIHRLLWRRIHVAVFPGELTVTEVTAIDRRGGIIETATAPEVVAGDGRRSLGTP
jgi:hypothetical protein